jgi:hypothetical protein
LRSLILYKKSSTDCIYLQQLHKTDKVELDLFIEIEIVAEEEIVATATYYLFTRCKLDWISSSDTFKAHNRQ